MKTILIANFYTIEEGVLGGCETVLMNLKQILQEAGYKVETVTFQSAMKAMNMPIPVGYHRYAILDRAIIIGKYLEQYEEMFGADVVIGFDGCLSFYTPKEACVISYLNNPYKDINEWIWSSVNKNNPQAVANYLEFGNVYPMLQERDLQRANKIVVPSEYMSEYIMPSFVMKTGIGYSMEVIPHGIDTDLFKPMDKAEMREKHLKAEMREKHLNDEFLRFGGLSQEDGRRRRTLMLTRFGKYKAIGVWNGAFHQVKNWDLMAELIRKRQDIFWVVIMKHLGVSEPKLKNVKLFNNVSYETVPELLNCADFYISVSQFESFGLCGVEAASCGLPVISTRTGIWKDWNPDNMGLFPDTSISSTSTAINSILKSRLNYTPREEIINSGLTLESWKWRWIELMKDLAI